MDTKKDSKSGTVTNEEFNAIEEAIIKDMQNGRNDARCPRCGNELINDVVGSSYAVRCKTEGCIEYEVRGI